MLVVLREDISIHQGLRGLKRDYGIVWIKCEDAQILWKKYRVLCKSVPRKDNADWAKENWYDDRLRYRRIT
jgi:hypothetical protein